MNEKEGIKILTEVAKEISKEVYNDGLKPATTQTGEILGTVVGFFNNVVLFPLKKINMTYLSKLEMFAHELAEKISDIPSEKLIEPKMNVLGPIVEALKYNYDEKELKQMFLNLLASGMNIDKRNMVHPAYVDIIKSMDGFDAVIFKRFAELGQCASSRTKIGYEDVTFIKGIPENYAPDLIGKDNPYKVSASIDNFIRLGLISLVERVLKTYNYEAYKELSFIKKEYEKICKSYPNKNIKVRVEGQALRITDFGKNFYAVIK